MKKLSIFLQLCALCFLIACNQSVTEKIDTGFVQDGKYINATIPLELSIPSNWKVFTVNENKKMVDGAVKMITSQGDIKKDPFKKLCQKLHN